MNHTTLAHDDEKTIVTMNENEAMRNKLDTVFNLTFLTTQFKESMNQLNQKV